MPDFAFRNGVFVPFAAAGIGAADLGFAAGVTVVDNARTYGGTLFRWADHLARFRRDCGACFVPLRATDDALTAAAGELVRRNRTRGGELHVVTFATPGELATYPDAAAGEPTLGMATYPVNPARYADYFARGAALWAVGSAAGGIVSPRVKHRSRLAWWVADHLPRPAGTTPILTTGPGETLTETAAANFLAVIDGVVCSPPAEYILDGVSLKVTRELCGPLGLPFAERALPEVNIPDFSEAMLCGTGFGVAGVRAVNGRELPWPGPVFRRLRAAWDAATAG